jgi:hypothetical protein
MPMKRGSLMARCCQMGLEANRHLADQFGGIGQAHGGSLKGSASVTLTKSGLKRKKTRQAIKRQSGFK